MTEPVTLRRALEVVLSRQPMSIQTSRALRSALADAIFKEGDEGPLSTIDEVRAAAGMALYDLDGLDSSFPKHLLLERIVKARASLRRAVGP